MATKPKKKTKSEPRRKTARKKKVVKTKAAPQAKAKKPSKKAKTKKKTKGSKPRTSNLAHATAPPALLNWYQQICDLVDDMVERGKQLDANSPQHAKASVSKGHLDRAYKWQQTYHEEILPTVRDVFVKELSGCVVEIIEAFESYHLWLTEGAAVVRREGPLPDQLGVSSQNLTANLRKLVQVDLKKHVALVAVGSPSPDRDTPRHQEPGAAAHRTTKPGPAKTTRCIQITHKHTDEIDISRAEYDKAVAAQENYTLFIDFTDTVDSSRPEMLRPA